MSESPNRSPRSRFSLLHLLTLTALIAVGLAVGIAYRSNRALTQHRDELLSLSTRLPMHDEDEVVSVAMPDVADDFHSWYVHVPDAQQYDLRLGIGDVSEKGIPPIVGGVQIPPGRHRVTLHTGDSANEEFRYVVYLDGELVIEKTMGKHWMPNGWSSASGLNWPTLVAHTSTALQLSGQSYYANPNFGSLNYFNMQSDEYVTRLGYRLWIDQSTRIYEPASPFIGHLEDSRYLGIGLRDGLRYVASSQPYQWTFTRPKLGTNEPVLRVETEFVCVDGSTVSSQSQVIKSWQVRNAATGGDSLRWQEEPQKAARTAFLHADSNSADVLRPVFELKWDVNQPDAVGIRLADTPANRSIIRWRLRILEGSQHLWQELQVGNRPWITPADALIANNVHDESLVKASKRSAVVDLSQEAEVDIELRWQAREALPLQIVARNENRYAGMQLYQGLPMRLDIQIPIALQPKLTVDVMDHHPTMPETALPGGPVFNAVTLEFEAAHEWVWLSAKSKE